MATETVTDPNSSESTVGDLVSDYAVVFYPLVFGISLIALGWLFELVGRGTEAGVSAAAGIIICGITVVVYAIFWALGRFGH
ncbi:hypothetical protein OB955_13725 [Halobacteria archaeon AArc-m2/3/4]|uniref:Uncharacterized protein n=1 Tax=Natronoglomus mannanivorans TaxID=2979990 RepID=A0AAP3E328_9EURY|nr:hypothetical protein [Halobacteria archaeon AArc-xg1-1]MCU4973793.1 hypothetical protein [Halobacteria archaeon AArc-m2/3/4]